MNQPGTLEADLELSASSVEELAGTDALSGGAESDVHFQATCHPQVGQFLELAEHDPGNPFITPEYVQAQVVLGENVSLLTLNSGSRVVTACPVFVKGKFLKRRLQIVSLPLLPCPAAFWSGLLKLCRAWSVWMLEVDSYGSLAADIPKFPGELVRHARTEYVMDLDHDVFDVPCHNHRRDIARARMRRCRGHCWPAALGNCSRQCGTAKHLLPCWCCAARVPDTTTRPEILRRG